MIKNVEIRSLNGLKRSGTVKNAQERSRTVRNGQERSRTFKNGQERSRTVRNGQERWTVRNDERSGTVNGQGRWTVCNDHTVQGKRSETIAKSRSRYVHGTFTVRSRSRSRFKNERNTVTIALVQRFNYSYFRLCQTFHYVNVRLKVPRLDRMWVFRPVFLRKTLSDIEKYYFANEIVQSGLIYPWTFK